MNVSNTKIVTAGTLGPSGALLLGVVNGLTVVLTMGGLVGISI